MLSNVEVLIDYQADLSCKNSNGETPLHIACSMVRYAKRIALVKLLLEKGADTSCLDFKGYSPANKMELNVLSCYFNIKLILHAQVQMGTHLFILRARIA